MSRKKKKKTRKQLYGERYLEKAVRDEVTKRDDSKCVYCGIKEREKKSWFKKPVKLHFGHVIPFSKGGDNCVDNLQLECANCNLAKGTEVWGINWVKRTFIRGAKGCTNYHKRKRKK